MVQHHHTSLRNPSAKADHVAIAPQVGCQRFTWIDGRAEAQLQRLQAFWLVSAVALQNRTGRHAQGAQPMKDRALEPRLAGNFRVDVNRVVIAAESVGQCRARRNLKRDSLVGQALWQSVRCRCLTAGAAAATVAPQDVS